MNKLPTVKSIVNLPSIFDGYTFEDMVTLGRISADEATSTCMKHACKEYMKTPEWENTEWEDINNMKGFLKAWEKLESQVHRKFKEAEEISSIL